MRLPLLPTTSDVAILAGAFLESRPVRTVAAIVIMIPAIAIVAALALATEIDDIWPKG